MAEATPEDLIKFFAYKSSGHMATTRLHKLAYLAQLHAVDSTGIELADISFIRQNHGPWSPELAVVIESFEAGNEDVLVERTETDHGVMRRFKPALDRTTIRASGIGRQVLNDVWSSFGYVATNIIIAFCKSASLFKLTDLWNKIDFLSYMASREDAKDSLARAGIGQIVKYPYFGYDWELQVEDPGFSAQNLDLPPVITQGETLEDLQWNMLEALLTYLDYKVRPIEASS